MTTKAVYDLYINTALTGIIHAAECVLEEKGGGLNRVGFRYTPGYLEHPQAFAIDPVQLPLQSAESLFVCRGGIPGILDDHLPDDWGKRVLAQLAFYRDKQRINANSLIDMLSLIGDSRIGALQWVAAGEPCHYGAGCSYAQLQNAEKAAQQVDSETYSSTDSDEMSLLYLANAGTGVGGARPKALVEKAGRYYLAKFNRLSQDKYNNARVELACLTMAKQAGLNVKGGIVETGINGREVLLLERFDIQQGSDVETPSRQHLITVNALLKDQDSQRDRGGPFRYDDIADLLRRYSANVTQDLEQLLRRMLFNRAINNTDDHERNFSLSNDGRGYRFAPAYDMVPTPSTGEYHVAGYQYNPYPPNLSQAAALGKVFGLSKTCVVECVDGVRVALESWLEHAEAAGVKEQEAIAVKKYFHQ